MCTYSFGWKKVQIWNTLMYSDAAVLYSLLCGVLCIVRSALYGQQVSKRRSATYTRWMEGTALLLLSSSSSSTLAQTRIKWSSAPTTLGAERGPCERSKGSVSNMETAREPQRTTEILSCSWSIILLSKMKLHIRKYKCINHPLCRLLPPMLHHGDEMSIYIGSHASHLW